MFNFTGLFKSFFDYLNSLFHYKKTALEKQDITEIICDKKNLKKAGNIAEQIIDIAKKYEDSMSKYDRQRLKILIKKFNKVD